MLPENKYAKPLEISWLMALFLNRAPRILFPNDLIFKNFVITFAKKNAL